VARYEKHPWQSTDKKKINTKNNRYEISTIIEKVIEDYSNTIPT